MNTKAVASYIAEWLDSYLSQSGCSGYIVGISGGIDSAVTSTLCAMTGKKVILLSMPIRQHKEQYSRSMKHIEELNSRFENVSYYDIDLTETFNQFEATLPRDTIKNELSMANSRARLRMTTLYAVGQSNDCLVAGTGNKIEDFGIGFYTKYGDGGVDVSPIADLTKTELWELGRELNIINEIIVAKPTDGLWNDNRCDEDQIGASYPELEWAMEFDGDESELTEREKKVLEIYRRLHRINKHKMVPIPICKIPVELK